MPKSQRVVLVFPPPDYNLDMYKRYDPSAGDRAPLGLLLLGTILDNNGFDVTIIDGQRSECFPALMAATHSQDVLCVGFSVMSSQYMISRDLSRQLKQKFPALPIVWGGFHPTIFPAQTLQNGWCDYVIRGEADKAFLLFCRFLQDGGDISEIPNLVYRPGEKTITNELAELSSFSEIPALNWSLAENIDDYICKRDYLAHPTRRMKILTGLGCNHRCAFCHNAIFRKKHRTRSAADIIQEMNQLHESLNIREFTFVDEDFFGNRKRLFEFLELTEHNRHRFKWSASLRAGYVREQYVNRELLKRIGACGCFFLGVGAESGSDVILQKIHKGIRVADILRAAEWIKDSGIYSLFSFMVGIPGETCDMTLETLRLIERIKRINPATKLSGPHVYRAYPGSPLYQEALRMGLQEPDDWNQAGDFLESQFHFRQINKRAIPWHSRPQKFKYMMLSYFLLDVKKNTLLRKIASAILQPLSRFRVKTGFYSLMIERPVLDYMNKAFPKKRGL